MPTAPSIETINAIVSHLRTGGTRMEADLLAMRLIEEMQAPQREADVQRRIADAVDAATKPAAPPVAPLSDDAPDMHRLAGGVVNAAPPGAVSEQ